MCCSIPDSFFAIFRVPSAACLKPSVPPRVNVVPHRKSPTPIAAVLKLLALQSTFDPIRALRPPQGHHSNTIPSGFVNQSPQSSPLQIQLFSSNGAVCITRAMINWTSISTGNPHALPRHAAPSSPYHGNRPPATYRAGGSHPIPERGHCRPEPRLEELENCDNQSCLSLGHRSPDNGQSMFPPPFATVGSRLTAG